MYKKSHLILLVLVATVTMVVTFQFYKKTSHNKDTDKHIQLAILNTKTKAVPVGVVPVFTTWLGEKDCHTSGLANSKDGGWGITCVSETPRQYNVGNLVKIDQKGEVEWARTFFERDLEISGVMVAMDGNYILVGSDSPTFSDRILAKEEEIVVVQDSMTNETLSYSAAVSADYWLAKIDTSGQEIWKRTYRTEIDHFGCAVIERDNGALLVAGTAFLEETGLSFSAMKTNVEGEVLWRREYPDAGSPLCNAAISTSQGHLLMGGTQTATREIPERIMLRMIDDSGRLLWQWDDHDHHGSLAALVETTNGNYAFIGQGKPSFVKVIDPSGNMLWTKNIVDDGVWDMAALEDDGILIAGKGMIMGFDSTGKITLKIKPAGVQMTGSVKLLLPDSETILLAGSGISEGTDGKNASGPQGFVTLLYRK